MKINNEFTVDVPVQQAWDTMLDLERIAPCLPGASILGKEDGEYQGTMKVKIGPITANYKGTASFEETDEENHRAVLNATGRDARGQGTALATIVSTLQEEGDSTKVNVETDMRLTGRAAQFGRGIAQDVATKMLDQFANCLETEISDQRREANGEGDSRYQAIPSPQSTKAVLSFGVTLLLALPILIIVSWYVLPVIWDFVWLLLALIALLTVVGSALLFRPWKYNAYRHVRKERIDREQR